MATSSACHALADEVVAVVIAIKAVVYNYVIVMTFRISAAPPSSHKSPKPRWPNAECGSQQSFNIWHANLITALTSCIATFSRWQQDEHSRLASLVTPAEQCRQAAGPCDLRTLTYLPADECHQQADVMRCESD